MEIRVSKYSISFWMHELQFWKWNVCSKNNLTLYPTHQPHLSLPIALHLFIYLSWQRNLTCHRVDEHLFCVFLWCGSLETKLMEMSQVKNHRREGNRFICILLTCCVLRNLLTSRERVANKGKMSMRNEDVNAVELYKMSCAKKACL